MYVILLLLVFKKNMLMSFTPLHYVDSRHLEYLVSQGSLLGEKKTHTHQEGFFQTDTVPPSGSV